MKQKHLAGLAALMVSAMGGAAFGDHHISGGQVDCSGVPFDCFDECLALKSCLEIPESGGTTTCASESSALAACEARSGSGPGGGSGGGVIIVPACQGGQHYHVGGGCHADHECRDDEIGGGSEDCTKCGEGEVPNGDGTACVACDWGETTPGVCNREPCQRSDADAAANSALSGSGIMKKEAQERGQIIYCENGQVKHGAWAISGSDKCRVYPGSPHGRSCLAGGSKRTGCNLTAAHSHPYFIFDRDENLRCGDSRITSPAVADELNRINMVFTSLDIATLTARQTDGHLLVSDRSAILPWRYLAVFPIPWAASTAGAEASNDD